MPLKIVFMGTPKFSVPALEELIKNKFSILSVYTQPPKRSKRGQKINVSPIQEFSKNNKLIPPYALKNEDLNFVEKGWREAADLQSIWYKRQNIKKISKK